MKKLLIAVIFSLMLVALWEVRGKTQYDVLERAFSAIIQVEFWKDGYLETGGNGFQLCGYDVGVTAYHVATDSLWRPLEKIQISRGNGILQTVSILYHDPETDMSIFDLPDNYPASSCLDLGRMFVRQEVYAVASLPAYHEKDYKADLVWSMPWVTPTGIVTGCCANYNDLAKVIAPRWGRLAQTNTPIAKGMSGSPIIDRNGDVVGLAVGAFSFIDTLFVPADEMKKALERYTFNRP